MISKASRLDRFVSAHSDIKRRDMRAVLAKKRVRVDEQVATDINFVVGQFSKITLDDRVLQERVPSYLMMNKPKGVVSATSDFKNRTVIDVLTDNSLTLPQFGVVHAAELHIAGRLDFNSTGLLLLTNDGRWSRRMSLPQTLTAKTYRVTVEKVLNDSYVRAFADGMHFAYENIVTRPAVLKVISDHVAEVQLVEGRYHQIKRMFGRFQNKVLQLHRMSVGKLVLDPALPIGSSRLLSHSEVQLF